MNVIGDVPVSTGEAGPGLRVERRRPRKISAKNQVPTIALPTLQCLSLPNRRSGKAAMTFSGHVHPHRIADRSRDRASQSQRAARGAVTRSKRGLSGLNGSPQQVLSVSPLRG